MKFHCLATFNLDKKINLKLVSLGDGEVGKTSIIDRFLGKEIPERYIPTIGTNTHRKDYIIKKKQTIIGINIWDLGGQKSFNPFNANHYSNVDIALLVFDLTKPKETLKSIKNEFLKNINQFSEDVLVLFIGNKLDLLEEKKLAITAIKELLTKIDHLYLVSAKTGENINECFELVIFTFLRKAEIIMPNLVQNNTATDFLRLIGKDEKTIKSKLLNVTNIYSYFQKLKPKLKVKKDANHKKEDKDLKYYEFLKNELQNNEIQITNAMDQFLINLTEFDKSIKHLKKTKSVDERINNLTDLLTLAKKDFEKISDLVLKLNREEFELVKIISDFKKEQLKTEKNEIIA